MTTRSLIAKRTVLMAEANATEPLNGDLFKLEAECKN
jgi:hypothetical protein